MPNPRERRLSERNSETGISLKQVSRSPRYELKKTFAAVVIALLPMTYQNEYAVWAPKTRLP
jgi:hypothetical protein